MSSEPTDEFTQMMRDAGFEVTEVEGAETVDETVDYTYVVISYETADGYPVTVRAEFPVGHAMDAARALVLSATADSIKQLVAGAAMYDDASAHAYLDSNGIDAAKYIEDTFKDADETAPPLSDADEFFTL